jgi:hypothetical protein
VCYADEVPSVLISYSHDPANPQDSENLSGLAASLMRAGLTVVIDQNRDTDGCLDPSMPIDAIRLGRW